MTDAPDRIWACMEGPMVGLFLSDFSGRSDIWPEYVRADIHAEVVAERDRMAEEIRRLRGGE